MPREQLSLFEVGSASEKIRSWAIIDPEDSRYRYRLWRIWDPTLPRLVWVMLNPSTADHFLNDPTIESCLRIAKNLGFGAIDVINLFAYRTKSPKELAAADKGGMSIIGPENDRHIADTLLTAGKVIAAWGAQEMASRRSIDVLRCLHRAGAVYCLGLNRDGTPMHPLYKPAKSKLIEIPKPVVINTSANKE